MYLAAVIRLVFLSARLHWQIRLPRVLQYRPCKFQDYQHRSFWRQHSRHLAALPPVSIRRQESTFQHASRHRSHRMSILRSARQLHCWIIVAELKLVIHLIRPWEKDNSKLWVREGDVFLSTCRYESRMSSTTICTDWAQLCTMNARRNSNRNLGVQWCT